MRLSIASLLFVGLIGVIWSTRAPIPEVSLKQQLEVTPKIGRIPPSAIEKTQPLIETSNKKQAKPELIPTSTSGETGAEYFRESGLLRDGSKIRMTETYWKSFLENGLLEMSEQIDAKPFVNDGQTKGVELTKVTDRSFAAKVGLHAGDVIESINGDAAVDSGQLFSLLLENRNTPNLQVRVVRDGNPMIVDVTIEK